MNWMRQSMSLTPSDLYSIILASGEGKRFGMPKSKAGFDGLLFSQRISQSLIDAGLRQIFIAEDLPTKSMLDTLREAQKMILGRPNLFLIWPVDHPFVHSETIHELFSVASANPDCVIKPEYHGKRGHPIIIPSALDLNDDQHQNLRDLIRYSGIGTVIVPVEDPGILMNINRPEDIQKLQEAYAETL